MSPYSIFIIVMCAVNATSDISEIFLEGEIGQGLLSLGGTGSYFFFLGMWAGHVKTKHRMVVS